MYSYHPHHHISHLFFRAGGNASSGVGNGGAVFENTAPNLEEWALLAILAGAGVCEEDTYGVRVRTFIDGT